MPMFRFTIRDVLWLMVVVGLAVAAHGAELPIPLDARAMLLFSPGRDAITGQQLERKESEVRQPYESKCRATLQTLLSTLTKDAATLMDGAALAEAVAIVRSTDDKQLPPATGILLRFDNRNDASRKFEAQLERLTKSASTFQRLTIYSSQPDKDSFWRCVMPTPNKALRITVAVANQESFLREIITSQSAAETFDVALGKILREERGISGSLVAIHNVANEATLHDSRSITGITWVDTNGSLRERWVAQGRDFRIGSYVASDADALIPDEELRALTGSPAGISTNGKIIDDRRLELQHWPKSPSDAPALSLYLLIKGGIVGQIGR
jgi:hypothetical protein